MPQPSFGSWATWRVIVLLVGRLAAGLGFVAHDLVFFVATRGRVRRRVAALVVSHGAVTRRTP